MTSLTVVVPCYNEEQTLTHAASTLLTVLDSLQDTGKISDGSQLYFVDDGSTDGTWNLIERLAASDQRVHGIKLSRNNGHQYALLAGVLIVPGDMVVTIDADLQDDPNAIEQMMDVAGTGKDIVLGVRRTRTADGWLKRVFAENYYRALKIMGVDIVFNHADFRLLSRRAIDALREYPEVNVFLRGIVPTLGFPTAIVTYDRQARVIGWSKYTIRRMVSLAIEGITSFSALPLRMIAVAGIVIFLVSLALSIWVAWVRLFSPDVVPGWASSVLPIYFLGGIQLLSIGILGEYVAKVYLETKRRPRFIVEKVI